MLYREKSPSMNSTKAPPVVAERISSHARDLCDVLWQSINLFVGPHVLLASLSSSSVASSLISVRTFLLFLRQTTLQLPKFNKYYTSIVVLLCIHNCYTPCTFIFILSFSLFQYNSIVFVYRTSMRSLKSPSTNVSVQ